MATEEICPTNLLDDSPADDDEFGSHERVAEAIVKLLETENEGGKSIGLEGGWGSGKSTVVRLVENKLSRTKNDDFRVAVFDMWAHQDDPLRRTFLENLIERVQDFGWVNKSRWELRRDKLAKRRSEETTRVLPRLTLAGMLFAVTLLAIPVGSGLISAGATLLASKDAPGDWAGYFLLIGTIGVFLPLFWYLIVAAIRKLQNRSGEDGEGMSEFSALVTGQSSTKSHTIATRTPDPTSVEFESEFRDLLDEALDPKKKRKLLLVVDNLDRVQPSDALAIWSTLQTFLGHTDYKDGKWLNRLWVLIPYDRDAILRLWDGSDGVESKAPNKTLTETFLDKTFQIRFRVPALLLTNWREFLHKVLKDALPNHQEEHFQDIYRTYGINGGLDKSPPKPRDLKIFANQIGALHRERQHDFELSHYACYVLLMKDVKNLHKDLISKIDQNLATRIIGDHWRDVIAAIHFGVDEDEARQLLLRGPIETALAESDGQTLADLRTAHPEGFWAVLDDCVPTGAANWNSLQPDELAKAASALVNSEVFDHAECRREARAIRSMIRSSALSVGFWRLFDGKIARGMVAIIQLVDAPGELIPTLTKSATNAYYTQTPPEEWMGGASMLVEGLLKLGFEKQLQQGVSVPLTGNEWLALPSTIESDDHERHLLQYFDIQAIQDVDRQIAEQLNRAQLDDSVALWIKTALATRSKNQLNETARAAVNLLSSNTSLQPNQLAIALQSLRLLETVGLVADSEHSELVNSGRLLHYLHFARANRVSVAVAECMFRYLRIVPDGHETARYGDSYAGHRYLSELLQNPGSAPDIVEHFIDIAVETQQIEVVLEMASGQIQVRPFFVTVLNTLLNSSDLSLSVKLLRDYWSVILQVLAAGGGTSRFESFLEHYPESNILVVEIVNSEFDVEETLLYVALLRSSGDSDFVNWCVKGLVSVDQQTWSEEFEVQGSLLKLVIELDKRDDEMTFGLAFFDALVTYAKKIAKDQDPDDVLPHETWDLLVNMLDSRHQALLPRRVYEILEEENGDVSSLFYDFFGGMLSSSGILADEPRFIDRICRPIVDTDNATGIAWLAKIASAKPQMLARHSDQAAVDDLTDRIRQRIETAPDDDPMLRELKRIGTALGLSSGSWWARR